MLKEMTKIAEPVIDINEISRIASGVTVKGEIASPSDIRIDGCVEGVVFSRGKIVVGENAVIKAKLFCNVIDLWGKLEGDIYVKETLSLNSTSSVEGNINVRKFQVEMGAQVNGACHMISESEYEEAVKKAFPELAAPMASKPNAVSSEA